MNDQAQYASLLGLAWWIGHEVYWAGYGHGKMDSFKDCFKDDSKEDAARTQAKHRQQTQIFTKTMKPRTSAAQQTRTP